VPLLLRSEEIDCVVLELEGSTKVIVTNERKFFNFCFLFFCCVWKTFDEEKDTVTFSKCSFVISLFKELVSFV